MLYSCIAKVHWLHLWRVNYLWSSALPQESKESNESRWKEGDSIFVALCVGGNLLSQFGSLCRASCWRSVFSWMSFFLGYLQVEGSLWSILLREETGVNHTWLATSWGQATHLLWNFFGEYSTQQNRVISLLSDACHGQTGQPDITSGSQAVKPRACFSFWVLTIAGVWCRQNGRAEPDTLKDSLLTAGLASGHWREFYPSLWNWPSLPVIHCPPNRVKYRQFALGTLSWNARGASFLGPLCAIFSLRIEDLVKSPLLLAELEN